MWPFASNMKIALLQFFCLILTIGINCEETNPLVFATTECFLKEPVYEHKFDFSKLHSDFAHQATGMNGDVFEYNLCGNMTRTCDGQKNIAACLKRGDKEFVLGTQHQLHYSNGKMFFSFLNGAKCPTGVADFQLYVALGCDYTLDEIQSHVTQYANNSCSFYITLESPEACLPEPDDVKANTCTYTDTSTGHVYNLMPLSDMNYITTDRAGSAFVINVCKPVLYGRNNMCPAGSSVCFVSLKATDYKKKYFNYGTVQPNPTFENGKLVMRLKSDTICNGNETYSSVIYFYCDPNVKNAHPEFIGLHGCVNEFSFVTPLACNNLAPCTTITHGNEILDMSSLKDKPFTLQLQDKSYTFAVCSGAGQPCLENDGKG
ncbi:cation-independent mannose-6-phosphate receptor-like [Teleopsis dalmanni]|uniref:cation-independent mannose-6-phosphate receptor-like n=1 Tax=Teleopsis dalmanni TaxID=139649 RepID=UPI0018CD4CAA|nr:cation-independent mannose-6-phosphate receptor-like [Teleopsis dalmanni]